MGTSDIQAIIAQVEKLLAEEELSERVEAAIQKLLNVVEARAFQFFIMPSIAKTWSTW